METTELKTLKDFELINYDEGGVWNFVGDLKAEAVKYIKDMQRNWKELGNYGNDNFAPESLAFMKFFNLTDADLKEVAE